jgi:hypothetical protein
MQSFVKRVSWRRHNIQHNDTQHNGLNCDTCINDTQHNTKNRDNQHNDTADTPMESVVMLCVAYAECRYAECRGAIYFCTIIITPLNNKSFNNNDY